MYILLLIHFSIYIFIINVDLIFERIQIEGKNRLAYKFLAELVAVKKDRKISLLLA